VGRDLGVKNGWRDGKLERRRRTPLQPESAMRGWGAEARVARAKAGVMERPCAGGLLWGGRLTFAGGGESLRSRNSV
jgi:hypothetical protein